LDRIRSPKVVWGFLEKWERDGLREPELLAWIARFRKDKWQAARDFWQEMYDGMAEAFGQDLAEPAPVKNA
jgi:glyceraldehyde-3-phosphate dehydrogenase (ferredoxin)